MRRIVLALALFVLASIAVLPFARVTSAEGPVWIVVNPGDTLAVIAGRYGTTAEALMQANNLPNPNFVYSGQRLLLPNTLTILTGGAAPILVAPSNAGVNQPPPSEAMYYTVSPGDSLAAIAARYGVSVGAIAQANNLTNWNFVWYGQRLKIPGARQVSGIKPHVTQPVAPHAQQPVVLAPKPVDPPTDGKWIDINVTDQTITAYEGSNPIKTVIVSTGVARTPTVLGKYKIIRKHESVHMIGGTPGVDYYDLPNVPYSMFFYQGYAIHGTYWHTNFGTPMSHGCVNLPTEEAKWFYEWAPMGTIVVSHR